MIIKWHVITTCHLCLKIYKPKYSKYDASFRWQRYNIYLMPTLYDVTETLQDVS